MRNLKKTSIAIIGGLIISCFLFGCGSDSDSKGACVRGSGITAGCGDDFTKGECDMINGDFHKGDSCEDLGFTSS